MTEQEFDDEFDKGELDEQYAMYLMAHAGGGERIISNGNTLILAMEDHYMLDDFKDSMVEYA